jgi:hypothetical protein
MNKFPAELADFRRFSTFLGGISETYCSHLFTQLSINICQIKTFLFALWSKNITMTLFCTFTKKLIFDKKSKKGHSLTNQTKVFWLNVANTGFINFVNFIFRQKSKINGEHRHDDEHQ